MNRSAGAPLSICFARAELAAYEIFAVSLLRLSYSFTASSKDSLRLAAANTTISAARACGGVRITPRIVSRTAAATRRARNGVFREGGSCRTWIYPMVYIVPIIVGFAGWRRAIPQRKGRVHAKR